VESQKPTEALEFTLDEVNKGQSKAVKFVNFQNVHSLTVFIETNHDEEEVRPLVDPRIAQTAALRR